LYHLFFFVHELRLDERKPVLHFVENLLKLDCLFAATSVHFSLEFVCVVVIVIECLVWSEDGVFRSRWVVHSLSELFGHELLNLKLAINTFSDRTTGEKLFPLARRRLLFHLLRFSLDGQLKFIYQFSSVCRHCAGKNLSCEQLFLQSKNSRSRHYRCFRRLLAHGLYLRFRRLSIAVILCS
jgi:hypothetical protein